MSAEFKILFLDDCHYNIKEAKTNFKNSNFEQSVTYCTCPLEALLLLKEKHYELLIVDYCMPIFNGFEFIGLLKRLKKQDLPVIAFSGEKKFNEKMGKFKNVIESFEKDYMKLEKYLHKNMDNIKKLKLV